MRRVEESTKAAAKWLQCNPTRVLIRKLYCHPARSFDFVPRFSLGTPLRMTGSAAFYAACLKRSLPAGCPRCRIPATFRCIRFRERALLHCTTCCAASGVSPLPYSANGRYYIIKPIARTAVVVNNITMPHSGCKTI